MFPGLQQRNRFLWSNRLIFLEHFFEVLDGDDPTFSPPLDEFIRVRDWAISEPQRGGRSPLFSSHFSLPLRISEKMGKRCFRSFG